jgi:MoxR-like ATPase
VPSVKITLKEWDAAREDVGHVVLSDRIVQELLRLRKELKANGVVVSDRRWIALTRVLRAAAWLDDAPEVELDHVAVLKYGLWQRPEDRARVKAVLDTVDRSAVAKAILIIDEALRAYAQRPANADAYLEALPKLGDAVTAAAKRVQEMLKDGVSRKAQARIQPKLEELRRVHGLLQGDLAQKYKL